MSLTSSEVRDAVRDWVVQQLPELTQVIWRDQNAPSAARPYATLKVTTKTRQGMASVTTLDDGAEVTQQQAEARAEVQIYAQPDDIFEAQDLAEKLDDSLDRWFTLQALRESGLAFMRVEIPPTDAAAVAGIEWEPRAIYEVTFAFNRRQDEPDVGIFEQVILNGEPIPEDN